MSLLHPTPGEVFDRISILRLKIKASNGQGASGAHLKNEMRGLIEHLYWNYQEGPYGKASPVSELELANVNCELWELEDRIRSTDSEDFRELARTAKEIAFLNDKRARLIRRIDLYYGCENPVEQKIYSCTQKK